MLTAIVVAEAHGQNDASPMQPGGIVIAPHNVDQLMLIDEIDAFARRIEFSYDGERVAFVSWEGPVQIRRIDDLQLISEFTTERGPISFGFSPDEDWVTYSENTSSAVLHNLRTNESIELTAGNRQARGVFNLDGSLLATGGYGTEAMLWSVPEGKLAGVLSTGSKAGGLRPVFSPNGELIAVGNRNSKTVIFDVQSQAVVHVFRPVMTHELAFSPDGARLAATYVDGTLRTWDVATGALLAEFASGGEDLYTVSWSPDGNLIATAGLQGDLIVAESFDLKPVARIKSPEWVISVRFTPDGKRLMCSGGGRMPDSDRSVRIYEISNE